MGGKTDARGVSFCGSVSVILIPERTEYRTARCDLWWTREDYFSFHQSAFSELKLFSLYENICPREARKKLYQPTEADREPNSSCSYGEYFQTDIDGSEDDYDNDVSGETKNGSKPEDSDHTVGIRPMQKVSSIDRLAQSATSAEDHSSNAPRPMQKMSSIEGLSAQSNGRMDSSEALTGLLHHNSSVPMDLCSTEEEDTTVVMNHSPTKLSAEAEAEYFLSFCVQMEKSQQLCTKTKRPGSGGIAGRRRRRSGKAARGVGDEIDPSNGLTFVLGLFSFTLPIVGYYVMHYCQ